MLNHKIRINVLKNVKKDKFVIQIIKIINVLIKKVAHQKDIKILNSQLMMIYVLNHAGVTQILYTQKMKHIVQMNVKMIKYGDKLVIKESVKMKQNVKKMNI